MHTTPVPPPSPSVHARRPWTPPRVEDLPHLNRLTLQSIPGDCGTGGSGSTCF
jgi:hypothetical protein